MKACKRCKGEFDKNEKISVSHPKDRLSVVTDKELCPACKEELWMLNLLGSLDT